MLAAHGLNLTTVFAEDRYFEALADITDPERKRKSSVNYSLEFSKKNRPKLVQST